MMKIPRRRFNASLLGSAALTAAGLPQLSWAQGGTPVEGTQYQRLAQPLPAAASGKIEVFEFFLYTCPHCYALDPLLSAWSKQLPADVVLRRIHVGVGAMHKLHQRMFYALEAMGRLGDLHEAVFKAFHVDHAELTDEKSITALMGKLGVDTAKFSAAFNSFGAQTRLGQMAKLATDYKVEGVPALGVGGRYLTAPSMAKGNAQALAVTDHLIKLVRGKA
ncbi:thiol:disulfide interchange protein DsbA/DsbL [Paucibacter sp. Y2R2-4]|uniref:thiol:disulfide interchange protein DsbA/DsbL n=1 Tax=Paucibacter sp. Y2R2-4 TaxID=2893553 RepID=UPI0021E3A286|nr:thiol:disulfide interchange protein DsbA/DsbL [Paucibacter sp. Y2R2-4]MCV2351379.1 thiol:disulfide interchange protein DsbA/DsbL [Paucibacter sp. Y2R2-4]